MLCKTVPSISRQVKPHSIFLSSANDSEERNSQIEGANGSPRTAGILSMPASQAAVPNPAKLARANASRIAGSGSTPAPLSHWQKKNMSELITRSLEVSSTWLGFKAFSSLQVKASGSLPRKQSQRTAKPTAFYAISAAHGKGVVNPKILKIRGRKSKI